MDLGRVLVSIKQYGNGVLTVHTDDCANSTFHSWRSQCAQIAQSNAVAWFKFRRFQGTTAISQPQLNKPSDDLGLAGSIDAGRPM
jgi:hypothetical protein